MEKNYNPYVEFSQHNHKELKYKIYSNISAQKFLLARGQAKQLIRCLFIIMQDFLCSNVTLQDTTLSSSVIMLSSL